MGINEWATPRSLMHHSEIAGNFKQACQNMLNWISNSDIMREQVVSISANETCTNSDEADAMITVIYRVERDLTTMTSLEHL